VLVSPEIPGPEVTKEKQEISGRVFNLLGDLGREESEEQEEIRKGESVEEYNQRMFEEVFGPIKKEEAMEGISGTRMREMEEEAMEKLIEDRQRPPTLDEYATAKKEQDLLDSRYRVTVGEDTGWLCIECNSVWDLEDSRCPACHPKAEPPTVEHRGWGDAKLTIGDGSLREYMKKHLEIKKTDKDLAIEAMRQALGLDMIEANPNAEECGTCGASDYLECDCCLECESAECTCCDECNRFPCQCDSEDCPICRCNIPVGEACPKGCDSEHGDIVKLYEEVKVDSDLSFAEKVKFMTLLRQKARIAEDVEEDERDPVTEDDPDGIDEDERWDQEYGE
jgi:hypothetical protein